MQNASLNTKVQNRAGISDSCNVNLHIKLVKTYPIIIFIALNFPYEAVYNHGPKHKFK